MLKVLLVATHSSVQECCSLSGNLLPMDCILRFGSLKGAPWRQKGISTVIEEGSILYRMKCDIFEAWTKHVESSQYFYAKGAYSSGDLDVWNTKTVVQDCCITCTDGQRCNAVRNRTYPCLYPHTRSYAEVTNSEVINPVVGGPISVSHQPTTNTTCLWGNLEVAHSETQ